MRRIVLLFLLIPFTSISQINKEDLAVRTEIIKEILIKENPEQKFRVSKGNSTLFLNYSQDQVKDLKNLFNNQFKLLKNALEKIEKSESEENLKHLIKVFVENEEEFRKFLNPEQLNLYLNYNPDTSNDKYSKVFKLMFLNSNQLELYKKSL